MEHRQQEVCPDLMDNLVLLPSLLPLLVVCCRAGMCVKPIHSLFLANLSSHLDVVWRARDVVVAPLDEDDVLAPLPHHVVHRVPPAALVLDHHLKQHFMHGQGSHS